MQTAPVPSLSFVPNVTVRVLFCIRASRNLYGYSYGPFKYSEEYESFVYGGEPMDLERWQAEGEKLIERFYKYRPTLRVLVAPIAVPVVDPVVVIAAEAAEVADSGTSTEESPTESAPVVKRTRKIAVAAAE